VRRRLFVDNCSLATTIESLNALFQRAGKVDAVSIPEDKNRGAKEIHAFILMSSPSEASAAIQMFNGRSWNGNSLTVTHASDSQGGNSGFSGGNNRLERKNR
jgi:RNA recognition motif-containing protein